MANYLNPILTIYKKDLKSEFRSKESIAVMVTFSILILVLFSMAFDPSKATIKEILPGIIWMGFIFSGILGFNRTFAREQTNDCLTGIMVAPITPNQVFWGKVLSNLTLILITEVISLPLYFVFYDLEIKGSLILFLLVILLGTLGFVLTGTFLAGLSSNFKAAESILPIILFPLLVPILLSSIEATGAIINGSSFNQYAMWLKILLVFDLVFFIAPILLIDYLLEVN